MINIIKSDLFRARKSHRLLISFCLIVAFSVLNLVFQSSERMDMVTLTLITGRSGIGALYQIMGQTNVLAYLFIVIFSFIGTDFSSGTFKNTISTKTNRLHYILAKYFFSSIFSTILFIFFLVFSFAFGSILGCNIGTFHEGSLELLKMAFYQYLILLAMNSFGLMLVFLLKKNLLAFVIYIIFPFALQFFIFHILDLREYFHFELIAGSQAIARNELPSNVEPLYPFWVIGIGVLCFLIGWKSFKKWDA